MRSSTSTNTTKRRLVSLGLILLSLTLIAAFVNLFSTGGVHNVGITVGGGSGDNGPLSWVDPELGIDIFECENLLDISDGTVFECSSPDGGNDTFPQISYVDDKLCIDGDEPFLITLDNVAVSTDCKYILYLSADGTTFERMEQYGSSVTGLQASFTCEGAEVNFEGGAFVPLQDGDCVIQLCSYGGSSGDYVVRMITVPN